MSQHTCESNINKAHYWSKYFRAEEEGKMKSFLLLMIATYAIVVNVLGAPDPMQSPYEIDINCTPWRRANVSVFSVYTFSSPLDCNVDMFGGLWKREGLDYLAEVRDITPSKLQSF